MARNTAKWSIMDTKFGSFGAVATSDGTVLASGWTDELDDLLAVIAPSLRPEQPRHVRDLGPITRAVRRYHDGELDAINGIPVRQRGGEFLEHAWEVLRTVPPGEPVSYSEYAALAGRPKAVRAAGTACSRNATALFVPCHRVLPSSRSTGGFRWGSGQKRLLLEHEGTRD